jgi:putative NADH-flavin reductase
MERQMKLTIFAATGGIGRQVLEQAVAARHDVTAVVRNPKKLAAEVRVVTTDLAAADPIALESAVRGSDAVLSGLGARSAADTGVAWRGTQAIVEAMTKAALRKHFADLAEMEDLVRDSELDWTVIRPPRLTDKPLTGSYRTAYGQNLRRGFLVSRADVAHLMLRVLAQPETIKQVVGIAS